MSTRTQPLTKRIPVLILIIAAPTILVLSFFFPKTPAIYAAAVTATPSADERITALEHQVENLVEAGRVPQKDIWDKLQSVSGLISGGAIALIGLTATLIYNERQRRAEKAQKEQEIGIMRVQTLRDFMPQLQSGDDKAVEAALLSITALGDRDLATKLALLYKTDGALSALRKMVAPSEIQNALNRAEIKIDMLSMERFDRSADDLTHQSVVEACISAHQRGVHVRRILVAFHGEDDLGNLEYLSMAGIEVREVLKGDLPPDSLLDFVIVDNEHLFLPLYGERHTIIKWELSEARSEIEDTIQFFDELWAS